MFEILNLRRLTRIFYWFGRLCGSRNKFDLGLIVVIVEDIYNETIGGLVSFWVLAQILLNIIFLAAVITIWIRQQRPQKDDPRLSKGLQLLQSKIAILEDLSDRTDEQVTQVMTILERKYQEIQLKLNESDRQIQKIDSNMNKSMEVAKIFQDRIPHAEILDRQNTIKYVTAAKMAHQGATIDQIASKVDLSKGEIEFIAKINRDQLMFCENSLPDWALGDQVANNEHQQTHFFVEQPMMKMMPEMNLQPIQLSHKNNSENEKAAQEQLKKIGDAYQDASLKNTTAASLIPTVQKENDLQKLLDSSKTSTLNQGKEEIIRQNNKILKVRPVQFKRIDQLAKDFVG